MSIVSCLSPCVQCTYHACMEPCDATYDFGNLDTVAIRRRKRPELGHGCHSGRRRLLTKAYSGRFQYFAGPFRLTRQRSQAHFRRLGAALAYRAADLSTAPIIGEETKWLRVHPGSQKTEYNLPGESIGTDSGRYAPTTHLQDYWNQLRPKLSRPERNGNTI